MTEKLIQRDAQEFQQIIKLYVFQNKLTYSKYLTNALYPEGGR